MRKNFKEYNQNEQYLFPPSLHDWLPEGHLAYFISEMVEEMDLSEIYKEYREELGQPPYSPLMMVKIWLYAFSQGIRSSRRVEKALHEDIGFRVISGNQYPDHWTINQFRSRHHKALGNLFFQSIKLAGKCGLVKLGHVAIDGTKIKGHASRHSAMSYGRMIEEEKRLKEEIDKYFKESVEIDKEEDKKHGKKSRNELPDEIKLKSKRLKAIIGAKKALEKEAKEKAKIEQEKRKEEAEKEGRNFKPRKDPDKAKPEDKAQRNFTDSESRIMKSSEKAFIQAYNAQAAVDGETQIIVDAFVTNTADDKHSLPPLIEGTIDNTGKIPPEVSADTGYYSEENLRVLKDKNIETFIPPEKVTHKEWRNMDNLPADTIPENTTQKDLMRRNMRIKLRTEHGKKRYKLRMTSIEPVFGQIKEGRGLRQFLLRGLDKVNSLWRIDCAVHNLLKIFRAKRRLQPAM
ncbi:MAG: IS1182 family transposase [Candidatus Eremiobacterota bacterium]